MAVPSIKSCCIANDAIAFVLLLLLFPIILLLPFFFSFFLGNLFTLSPNIFMT